MIGVRAKCKVIAAAVIAAVAFVVSIFARRPSGREKSAEKRARAAEEKVVAGHAARLREQVRHEAERRRDELARGSVDDRAREWARARDSARTDTAEK